MSLLEDENIVPFKLIILKEGKVVEIRRVRLSNPTIEAMLSCCKADGKLSLQYTDNEGDLITMSDEAEWQECVTLWKISGESVLKLRVTCQMLKKQSTPKEKKKKKKTSKQKKSLQTDPESHMLESILSQASAPEEPALPSDVQSYTNRVLGGVADAPASAPERGVAQNEIDEFINNIVNESIPSNAVGAELPFLDDSSSNQEIEDFINNIVNRNIPASAVEAELPLPDAPELLLDQDFTSSMDQLSSTPLYFEISAARQIAENIYGPTEIELLCSSVDAVDDGKLKGFGGWLAVNQVLNMIVVVDVKKMIDEVITFSSVFEAEKKYDSAIILISLALEFDEKNYELWYSLARMKAFAGNSDAMDTAMTAVDLGLAKGRIDNDHVFNSCRPTPEIPQQKTSKDCRSSGCFRLIQQGKNNLHCCGKCKNGKGHTRRCVSKTTLFAGQPIDKYAVERTQLQTLGYRDENRLLEAFGGDINAVIDALNNEPSSPERDLSQLREMGFTNDTLNRSLLQMHEGDLSRVVAELSIR